MEISEKWTKEYKEAYISKEKKRLTALLKDLLPEDKKKATEGLIDQMAFQRVALDEIKENLIEFGFIESYQNGENQKGIKKSSFAEVYDKYLNTYSKLVKQVTDLIDKTNDSNVPGAEIMKFLAK